MNQLRRLLARLRDPFGLDRNLREMQETSESFRRTLQECKEAASRIQRSLDEIKGLPLPSSDSAGMTRPADKKLPLMVPRLAGPFGPFYDVIYHAERTDRPVRIDNPPSDNRGNHVEFYYEYDFSSGFPESRLCMRTRH